VPNRGRQPIDHHGVGPTRSDIQRQLERAYNQPSSPDGTRMAITVYEHDPHIAALKHLVQLATSIA
jgi:hypothetical protein